MQVLYDTVQDEIAPIQKPLIGIGKAPKHQLVFFPGYQARFEDFAH